MKRATYVINEFEGAKSTVYVSPFIQDISIKIKSVALPKGTLLGQKLSISPHTIYLVAFGKTEIYAMAEKMLKERKDVDANEKLLQAIKTMIKHSMQN